MVSKQRGRLVVLCVSVALLLGLAGCAGLQQPGVDSRLKALEVQLNTLQQQFGLLLSSGVGASFRPYTVLTGGGTGALDKTDGSTLALGDAAFVVLNGDATYGSVQFTYVYHDFAAETSEDSPWVIKPDTNPNANYGWQLVGASTLINIPVTGALAPTAIQCRLGIFEISVANTITLPTAASVGFGNIVLIKVRDTTETCTVGLNGSEKFNISGTAQAVGVTITSPGAAGDWIALMAVTDADGAGGTDGYVMVGYGLTAWAQGS